MRSAVIRLRADPVSRTRTSAGPQPHAVRDQSLDLDLGVGLGEDFADPGSPAATPGWRVLISAVAIRPSGTLHKVVM